MGRLSPWDHPRGIGGCRVTPRSNKPCAMQILTRSGCPDSRLLRRRNSIEPPWYEIGDHAVRLCDNNDRVACASRPAVTRLAVRIERRDVRENPAYKAFNPVPCGVLPTAQGARTGILCYSLSINVCGKGMNP